MKIIKFDITSLEDFKAYGLTHILEDIFSFSMDEVTKGNLIKIERRSTGQPVTLYSISTKKELTEFKEQFL